MAFLKKFKVGVKAYLFYYQFTVKMVLSILKESSQLLTHYI